MCVGGQAGTAHTHTHIPRLTVQAEDLDGGIDLERGRHLRHAGVADPVVCMQQGHVGQHRDKRPTGRAFACVFVRVCVRVRVCACV